MVGCGAALLSECGEESGQQLSAQHRDAELCADSRACLLPSESLQLQWKEGTVG